MIIIWAAAVLSFFAVFSILLSVYYSPAAQRRSLSGVFRT